MTADESKLLRFTLLGNGLDFVWSAVEHLETAHGRKLKYAILHLVAGVELILKERLRREHWSLIFEKPEKAHRAAFEAGNFVSVSMDGCVRRLSAVCDVGISNRHRERLSALKEHRNRLEHFGIAESAEALIAVTNAVLSFLLDFISSELQIPALSDEEQSTLNRIRRKLGDLQTFVDKRWKAIGPVVEAADTPVVQCPACLETAAIVSEGIDCKFCGHRQAAKDAADEYIGAVLGESYYSTIKEGGEWPLYECPECSSETLVDQADRDGIANRFVCFDCGQTWGVTDLRFCDSCGRPYRREEDGATICDDCFRDKVARSD
jgi:hypothetical protein